MRKIALVFLGLVWALGALAQGKTVTGKVTDKKGGSALAGVSVTVQGGTTGTKTEPDGSYRISVSASAKILVFSYIGFQTATAAIPADGLLNVSLDSAETQLEEVVVTALGIKKDKKTLGYGVSTVNEKELNRTKNTNITNSLVGKVPGVRVSGSGGAFTGSSIIIRGFTTFTGSNQPLFVVDGIPIDNSGGGSPLQNGPTVSNRAIDLNSEDVETMTVLKGPSAAVLYGSRASNGVILITTKKGKASQKKSIEFSSTYGVETVNRIPDYQNQYAQGNNGVFSPVAQTSWGPLITGQTVTNAYDPATNTNTRTEQLKAYENNVEDIFVNGTNWQNNVAFTGGSDRNTFRLSYGYLRNTGVLENNSLTRHNISLNSSSKVNSYLTVSASANYSNNASKRTQQGNQLSNPLFRGWFTPRSYDLTGLAFEDAVGNQRYPLGEDNPYWTIKHNRYNDEINRLIGNIGLNFKLASWLQADYKIGTDLYSVFRHGYDQIGARGGANTSANGIGGVRETRNNYRSLNSNAFFTANKRILDDWNATAIVGTEFQQIYSNTAQLDGKGIIVRDFEQLSNTTTYSPSPQSSLFKTRLFGLYGDFTVAYRSIFSLNFTLRNDWSSTFEPENNSYLYNGIGGSLNITELVPSLKGNILDNLKLRGNVATVGKAGDFAYSTDSYFGAAGSADGFGPTITFPFNGLQGFTLSNTAGNPELGPEFTTNKELALEAAMFNRLLNFELTVYEQQSRDLIFAIPVSAAAGISSAVQNVGKLSNKGIELGFNIMPIRAKDFQWSINYNYTQFKSKVEELAPGVSNIFLGGFTTPNVRLVKGEEYGQLYGNAYQRDTKTGKIIVGANGLPLITSGVQNIGNPNPKFLMGLTNTLTFESLSFSFLLDYKKGGDIYSRNIADLLRNGVVAETAEFARYDANGVVQKPYLFDAVYANGQPNTTMVSAQDYFGNSGIHAAAEGFIYETTWFRLREMSLTYNMPASLLKKTPFGLVELSLFGRNLFLNAPNYPHLDPEQNALGISNAQGLEFNALPQTRSMGVGLKISF